MRLLANSNSNSENDNDNDYLCDSDSNSNDVTRDDGEVTGACLPLTRD